MNFQGSVTKFHYGTVRKFSTCRYMFADGRGVYVIPVLVPFYEQAVYLTGLFANRTLVRNKENGKWTCRVLAKDHGQWIMAPTGTRNPPSRHSTYVSVHVLQTALDVSFCFENVVQTM